MSIVRSLSEAPVCSTTPLHYDVKLRQERTIPNMKERYAPEGAEEERNCYKQVLPTGAEWSVTLDNHATHVVFYRSNNTVLFSSNGGSITC
jgi:hypothetical protein